MPTTNTSSTVETCLCDVASVVDRADRIPPVEIIVQVSLIPVQANVANSTIQTSMPPSSGDMIDAAVIALSITPIVGMASCVYRRSIAAAEAMIHTAQVVTGPDAAVHTAQVVTGPDAAIHIAEMITPRSNNTMIHPAHVGCTAHVHPTTAHAHPTTAHVHPTTAHAHPTTAHVHAAHMAASHAAHMHAAHAAHMHAAHAAHMATASVAASAMAGGE